MRFNKLDMTSHKLSKLLRLHKATKIQKLDIESLDPKKWPESWRKVYSKSYLRLDRISLQRRVPLLSEALGKVLLSRKSDRDFKTGKLGLKKLSSLLYYSAGVLPLHSSWDYSHRFYPSAGARYPLEVYLFIKEVESLSSGVYHYNVKEQSVELLWKSKEAVEEVLGGTGQEWVSKSKLVIALSVVFERTEIKYGPRAYRYVLIESGHLSQNIYLVGKALNLKICSIGGFVDDKINRVLDLNEEKESVICLISVGA